MIIGNIVFQLTLSLSKSRSLHHHLVITNQPSHPFLSIHVLVFVCLGSTFNADPAFVIGPLTRSRTLDGPGNDLQLCERLDWSSSVLLMYKNYDQVIHDFEQRKWYYRRSKPSLRHRIISNSQELSAPSTIVGNYLPGLIGRNQRTIFICCMRGFSLPPTRKMTSLTYATSIDLTKFPDAQSTKYIRDGWQ